MRGNNIGVSHVLSIDHFNIRFFKKYMSRISIKNRILRNCCENVQCQLFSDECFFTSRGIHNRQNLAYCRTENLQLAREVLSQYIQTVNVFMRILGHRIIGLVFIDGALKSQKYFTTKLVFF